MNTVTAKPTANATNPNPIPPHLMRQWDLIPEAILYTPITIIGAGAIGSMAALCLAKSGFSDITAIDPDVVSIENMNNQFYPHSSIGLPKVVALQGLLRDMANIDIRAVHEKYEYGTFPGIVISAVDSMAVRRTIWDQHEGKALATLAVVDPRMSALTALLYVMRPMDSSDRESYPHSLYTDSEAVQEACTARATCFTAMMIGGLVAKATIDVLTTKDYLRTAMWSIKANQLLAWTKDWGGLAP